MKAVGDGQYQRACAIHFDAVNGQELSTGIVTHPNQWFLENRRMPVRYQMGWEQRQNQEDLDESKLDMFDDADVIAAMDAGWM